MGGQRGPEKGHGEDSQGTEEVHLSKGKVKKHKIWDNPTPLKNDKHNTIRKSNISLCTNKPTEYQKTVVHFFRTSSFL